MSIMEKEISYPKPEVSIITPVYNAEKYIEKFCECIDALDFSSYELIFVNDGSLDESFDLLNKYCELNYRARVLSQDNNGPGNARNTGLKQAQGKYVAFWDVDDFFEKSILKEMVDIASRNDADITVCSFREYYEDAQIMSSSKLMFDNNSLENTKDCIEGKRIAEDIFQIFGYYIWNKIFKREFIEKSSICFAPSYYNEDLSFCIPALSKANKIGYTYKELLVYRRNKGDSLCDSKDKYWKDNIISLGYADESVRNGEGEELYLKSWMKTLTRLLSIYFREFTDSEAISGLYSFADKHVRDKISLMQEEDFFEPEDADRWDEFLKSESALDFVIRLKKIRSREKRFKKSIKNIDKFFPFPYWDIKPGERIVLYGAGNVGSDLFVQMMFSHYAEVCAWVDSNYEKYAYEGYPVQKKEILKDLEFDRLIICIVDEEIANTVKSELCVLGIPYEKLIMYSLYYDKDEVISRLVKGKKYNA